MISSAEAPRGLFSSLFDLVIHAHPVSLLGGQVHPAGPSPEELTAHLAPHLLVDIGLADPHTAGRGARAPALQPLIPPVAAMHRRGDWGGHSLGSEPEQADRDPIRRPWIWPMRVI